MKKLRELLEKPWFAYTLATCSAVLLFVLLTHLKPILDGIGSFLSLFNSIVIGIVIAYLLDPIAGFFETKVFVSRKKKKLPPKPESELTPHELWKKQQQEGLRRSVSVAVTIILVIALITLLLVALIPSIGESIAGIVGNVDTYSNTAQRYMDNMTGWAEGLGIKVSNISSGISDSIGTFVSGLPEKLVAVLTTSYNVGVGIGNLVIGFILSVYFLIGKKGLLAGIDRLRRTLLTEKVYETHTAFWTRCHDILLKYVGFDVLDGIIVGIVNAIFMAAFQMPYVALISVIVGATNLLPTFGPMIGAALGGFILVLTDPILALAFLIFTVVLQTVDGYILKPRLFGDAMGVPPVWTLIAIIIGGKMFGVVGILLAIPAAAVLAFTYEDWIAPWLAKQTKKRQARELKEESEEQEEE